MAKRTVPTAQDCVDASRTALSAIADDGAMRDARWDLQALHPEHDTFPGEVFLELAADAIAYSGSSREQPIPFEGIRERYLPDHGARTGAQHRKSIYALRAAAMTVGGVDPGVLDEVSWWRTDDFWLWAFDALTVYTRAAADRRGEPVAQVCAALARARGIDLRPEH